MLTIEPSTTMPGSNSNHQRQSEFSNIGPRCQGMKSEECLNLKEAPASAVTPELYPQTQFTTRHPRNDYSNYNSDLGRCHYLQDKTRKHSFNENMKKCNPIFSENENEILSHLSLSDTLENKHHQNSVGEVGEILKGRMSLQDHRRRAQQKSVGIFLREDEIL